MTREEIIKGLYLIQNWKCNGDAEMYAVITNAINALELCEDAISRQTAIDAAALSAAEWDGMYVQDINGRIRKALEKLPPAQPERKKGKWIKNDNGTYSCSLCHSWIPEEQHYYAQFCLYCGADMRGEPNETD